jgi:uncharacterized protein YyaL (SSP411 family)
MNATRQTVIGIICLVTAMTAQAQKEVSSAEYLERAESMFQRVWTLYRVPEYGLFSENFPRNPSDSLTYLQGASVKEKEVSFLWPFSGLFSAANVLLKHPQGKTKYRPYLDSLVWGIEQYRDSSRKPPGYQAYPVRFEKADRYYDDNGLVGIDYAEAYLNTCNPLYLQRAKEVFSFIISGWDGKLEGGVTWLEGHRDQKPACSNGMAVLTALKIYEGSKDSYYLQWGKRFYDWMRTNLSDSTGVYWNDKKMNGDVNRTYWTYNSGSMLEASVLLYEFTRQKEYMKEAERIAKGSFHYFTRQNKNPNHLLHIDLPWFVTVLYRGYEKLYQQNGDRTYINAIIRSLDYAWENARDKNGLVTSDWTADPEKLTNPKRLLDEGCIAELYARISRLPLLTPQKKKHSTH